METNNSFIQIIRFWSGFLKNQELRSFVEWMEQSDDNIEKVFIVYDILYELECLDITDHVSLDKVWQLIMNNN